jgi:2-dehydro-3-deoxyphosphogalactonate aldolase
MTSTLRAFLNELPLVAVLRGITPEEMPAALEALTSAGFRIIEVPLNSPRPLESLRYLGAQAGERLLTGAGTVLDAAEVDAVAEAGGRLIVSPNADPGVIAAAKRRGLVSLPGVATPSEAFVALKAGADGLKMFPAEVMPPKLVKAWRAVLPAGTALLPVGGIEPESMAAYFAAGADGFGIGSALYKPGMSAAALHERAAAFVAACRAARPG